MTQVDSDKLARNVEARRVSNELVELGITLAKESGLDAEQTRRMWQYVMETAGELVGDKVVVPRPKVVAKEFVYQGDDMTLMPHDTDEFPFGKHKGEQYGKIPDSYFRWLAKWEHIEKWPAVLAYIQEHDLD